MEAIIQTLPKMDRLVEVETELLASHMRRCKAAMGRGFKARAMCEWLLAEASARVVTVGAGFGLLAAAAAAVVTVLT